MLRFWQEKYVFESEVAGGGGGGTQPILAMLRAGAAFVYNTNIPYIQVTFPVS